MASLIAEGGQIMAQPNDSKAFWTPAQRANNDSLALCYAIHGVLVGGFWLVAVGMNSQAARNATEGILALTAVLLQPMPMFVTSVALRRGWRWARKLAMVLPFLLAPCGLEQLVWPYSLNHGSLATFFYLQIMNIPGAIGLAITTVVTGLFLDGTKGNPPDNTL
jgi:hypothetical protein